MASSDQDQNLDRLWQQIDDAMDVQDVEQRRSTVEEIINGLYELAAAEHSSSVLYSIGYAWYVHPDRMSSESIQQKLEDVLMDAIRVDPDCARAWLYLGHNAYDLGRYALAKDRFDRIAPGQLDGYLELKAEEMRLCCSIRLLGLAPSLDALERFVTIAEQHPVQDIWPQELAKVLRDSVGAVRPVDLARLEIFARRLDAVGQFGDWFVGLLRKAREAEHRR
jgi:hypothetical protein